MTPAGRHGYADMRFDPYPGCDALVRHCAEAITRSGMTVVDHLTHRFEPFGLTAVWVLAESHFTLHTYPEHSYASVDCYTCGTEGSPGAALRYLLEQAAPTSATVDELRRAPPP